MQFITYACWGQTVRNLVCVYDIPYDIPSIIAVKITLKIIILEKNKFKENRMSTAPEELGNGAVTNSVSQEDDNSKEDAATEDVKSEVVKSEDVEVKTELSNELQEST